VSDDQCPGTIDPVASTFEVEWLPRPKIKLPDTAVLIPAGDKYIKREVCEGDIDAIEINLVGKRTLFHLCGCHDINCLIGASPFYVKYRIHHRPEHGSGAVIDKEFAAALGLATIAMDTTKSGTYEYRFSELSDNLYTHDPRKKFAPLVIEQKVNRKPAAHFIKPGQSYKYCKEELAGDEVIPIRLEGVPPFSLEVDIKHQSNSRPETVKIANIESNHYDFRIPHRVLSLGIHQVSVRKVRDSNGCQQKTEYGAPNVQVQVYDVPTIYPLESRSDYCVGERISYTLSGTAPFEIFYTFEDVQRKAKSPHTNFKRIAEKPGMFTITAISDKASDCKAQIELTKVIHEMPSVKISKGRQLEVDIHEGGEAEILFEFWGTPPFEFTYTRSTNAKKGQKSRVLETRHEVSYEYSKTIQSSQEGTYEVVAIKDKFCSFTTQLTDGKKGGQKLLQF
jgi:nucleoporin POM152